MEGLVFEIRSIQIESGDGGHGDWALREYLRTTNQLFDSNEA